MTNLGRTAARAALIVIQATVIGFAANAVSPHRLPWIRIPLKATHRIAAWHEVLAVQPSKTITLKPKVVANPPVEDAAENAATRPVQVAKSVNPPVIPRTSPSTMKMPSLKTTIPPKIQPTAVLATKLVTKPKKIEALFTTLPDAKALFDRKTALFIDAREKEDYDLEHIQGAQSLCAEDLDKLYDGVLGKTAKDQVIVTYCSDPQCDTAIKLADALVARGHTHVFILLEGLPGWKDAGYPTTTGGAQ